MPPPLAGDGVGMQGDGGSHCLTQHPIRGSVGASFPLVLQIGIGSRHLIRETRAQIAGIYSPMGMIFTAETATE